MSANDTWQTEHAALATRYAHAAEGVLKPGKDAECRAIRARMRALRGLDNSPLDIAQASLNAVAKRTHSRGSHPSGPVAGKVAKPKPAPKPKLPPGEAPAEKTCTVCCETKGAAAFRNYGSTRDGLDTQCRTCRATGERAREAVRRERLREATSQTDSRP